MKRDLLITLSVVGVYAAVLCSTLYAEQALLNAKQVKRVVVSATSALALVVVPHLNLGPSGCA